MEQPSQRSQFGFRYARMPDFRQPQRNLQVPWKSPLQLVDVDRCVEQKLWQRPRQLTEERERGTISTLEGLEVLFPASIAAAILGYTVARNDDYCATAR